MDDYEVSDSGPEMERVFKDEDFEQGELIFKTDIADKPDQPWWKLLGYMFLCGALVGLLGWYRLDGNTAVMHFVLWCGGGGVVLSGILSLPAFRKNELKQIRIFEDGFRVVDRSGTKSFLWADVEAAHFETYPVVNMGTEIRCFEFRVHGKNHQVCIDGFGDEKIKLFWMVMDGVLGRYGIAKESKGLRTFQYYLSLSGFWLFAVSLVGMIIAYAAVLRTLGIIFGLAVMFTGTILALITWRQRLSRVVIALTIVIVAGGAAFIKFKHVSVRETLLKWEQQERELGRPPWGKSAGEEKSE